MTAIRVFVFFVLFGCSESFLFPLSQWLQKGTFQARPQSQHSAGLESSSHYESSSSSEWAVVGVSVSPKGFHVILFRVGSDDDQQQQQPSYLPIAVTPPDAFQDSQSATSVESLTLLQLLNGVDLAGPILPPDILGRMVVLDCYDDINGDSRSAAFQQKILGKVQKQLPTNTTYVTAHPLFRSKVSLPVVTLDRLRFSESSAADGTEPAISYTLECNLVEEKESVQLPIAPTLLEQATQDLGLLASSPSMAAAFLGIALALRYKAPLTMIGDSTMLLTKDQLVESFPMYRTKEKLQVSSDRVSQSIERGFQVHLLTRALEMARNRGDVLAAAKIRAKLDDYDRLDELPTIPFQYGNEGQEESDYPNKSWQDLPLQ